MEKNIAADVSHWKTKYRRTIQYNITTEQIRCVHLFQSQFRVNQIYTSKK